MVELIVKYMSDCVRKGAPFSIEIPMVGCFMMRTKIVAVSFNREVQEQTRGTTARAYTVGNLFSNSNAVLNQGLDKQKQRKAGITVSNGANDWLQSNLGIDLDALPK